MKKIYVHVTVLLFATFFLNLHAQTITTIAGTGTAGYNGDNMAATIAQLNGPAGVITDRSGNVVITDFLNNRIRKVDVNGFITSIAGTGSSGYNGDNIPATSATLFSPESPYYDQNGNLYFTDGNNNRIRKISTTGTITTIAGTGTAGYNGDGIAATTAQLNFPTDGVIVDKLGNVYISDTYNHRIRKVSTSGIITTIAGTGTAGYNGDNTSAISAQLNFPYGLCFDSVGNIYVADGGNNRIRKITPSGIITTVAGNGAVGFNGDNLIATNASIYQPCGVIVDGGGNIFIADTRNNRIRKVNTSGIISTICGNGSTTYNGDNITATLATVNYPNGLAIDAVGNLLIAELGNNRIRKISNAAIILPLTLTKFTASLQNGSGILQWQTTNEIKIQKFIIERSQDGLTFYSLDSLNAKNVSGTNNYSFTDATIKNGVTYYRLKITDIDGKFTYSKVVTLRLSETISIGLSPNPVENSALLSFTSSNTDKYVIQVMDMTGKVISQSYTTAVVGSNKVQMNTSSLIKGAYIVMVINSEGKKASIKFTK